MSFSYLFKLIVIGDTGTNEKREEIEEEREEEARKLDFGVRCFFEKARKKLTPHFNGC